MYKYFCSSDYFRSMALTYKPVNYQDIRRGVLIVARIIVVSLILTYFGASLVISEEKIPFCKIHLKELQKDEQDWGKRCFKDNDQKLYSSSCEAEKEYFRERMCMHSRMCFYKGTDYAHKFFKIPGKLW